MVSRAENNNNSAKLFDFVARERWVIPLALIVLYFIAYTILFPKVFFTKENFAAVLIEFSIPAIVVIGMAMQLIGHEIDLSVGYNVMLTNVLVGVLIYYKLPIWLAIVVTIGIASLFGFVVGLLVSRVGVNSFIATLGLGLVFYGLSQFIYTAAGKDIKLPEAFLKIGQGELFGIQYPVFIAIVLIALFSFLTLRTNYFQKLYYVGMNKDAAQLSGINAKNMKTLVFTLTACLSAFAGVLLAARMGGVVQSAGKGWELKVITGAVIGGVSFTGGVGTILGAALGLLFTICLENAMRIVYAPTNIYNVIQGTVLLLAVILDSVFARRKIVG